MFHARDWTRFDTVAVLLLCLLCLRVFGGGQSAEDLQWYQPPDQVVATLPHLTTPPPRPSEWAASRGAMRMEGVVRCIGLAETRRRAACGAEHTRACRMAELDRRIAEYSLWPRGREGQFMIAHQRRIQHYADAYAALPESDTQPMRASSRLIRDRDDAICREYLRFTKALPHEQEIRQSRRAVQEGAG